MFKIDGTVLLKVFLGVVLREHLCNIVSFFFVKMFARKFYGKVDGKDAIQNQVEFCEYTIEEKMSL